MYELLVVVHILSGMAWLGGASVMLLGLRGIRTTEGHIAADRTMASLDKTMGWIFGLAPFLLIATGVTMVAVREAWRFSQMWVYLAIFLFVAAAILGGVLGDRLEKQMKQAREDGTTAPAAFDRFLRLGSIEMAILPAIVFLMVYKPI
jgi:uncharacterized membrane protein